MKKIIIIDQKKNKTVTERTGKVRRMEKAGMLQKIQDGVYERREFPMVKPQDFRTRQEFCKRKNPAADAYLIGLDAGYSSMKVFYEEGYFCFPSSVKHIEKDLLIHGPKDILYKDLDSNELYMIGETAQEMQSNLDTNETEEEMFSRRRYRQKNFRILLHAAIGLACMEKQDDRPIMIQTGLPSAYRVADTAAMQNAVSEHAHFALKIGSGPWKEFTHDLPAPSVIEQPQGALYSVLVGKDGKQVSNAMDILLSNTLIMDVGFGTFDFYGIMDRQTACENSIDNVSMKRIMQKLSEKILKEYGEEVKLPALDGVLKTGMVRCFDEDSMQATERPIDKMLEEANEEVFAEAMEKAKSVANYFRDYRYLIIAGGTGEAWYDRFEKQLSGISYLTILPANVNDDSLPMLYSTVRGYYMLRYNQKETSKAD